MKHKVYVVGAGLAGLSAALNAQDQGSEVCVFEGAGHAGGRCRSLFDKTLDRQIDNGNHLILTGNTSAQRYLNLAGNPQGLVPGPAADYPFIDLKTDERWTVSLNEGPIPYWTLSADRRPKGVSLLDLVPAARLFTAKPHHTIGDVIGARGKAWARFWEPMSYAVMNLPPERASATLLRAVFAETFFRSGARSRPMFAPNGLGPALVDPALTTLERRGAELHFNHVLTEVSVDAGRVIALSFANGHREALAPGDRVILALPPVRLNAVYPDANAPEGESEILNAHFVLDDPSLGEGLPPLVAVLGGITQWIFPHGDVISLTVSSSQDVDGAEEAKDVLAPRLWAETVQALGLPKEARYSASRLIRERRATFRQTPDAVQQRPTPQTQLFNLFLAGDAVDTGLPATIEGAIRSGETAARLAAR